MSTAPTPLRRIVVKDHDGYPVLEMPLYAGVVVAVVAPVAAVIGTVAALANEWSIEVEREQPGGPGEVL